MSTSLGHITVCKNYFLKCASKWDQEECDIGMNSFETNSIPMLFSSFHPILLLIAVLNSCNLLPRLNWSFVSCGQLEEEQLGLFSPLLLSYSSGKSSFQLVSSSGPPETWRMERGWNLQLLGRGIMRRKKQ